jgi:FtsH-binding integral membrane protein
MNTNEHVYRSDDHKIDMGEQEFIMEDLKNNPNIYGSTDLDGLANFSGVDHEVQRHLVKVYGTLGVTILFCGLGAYIYTQYHINLLLGFACSIALTFYLYFTAGNKNVEHIRYGALFAFGLCHGLNAGVLVVSIIR